jgi:hypothetical protein
MRCPFCNQPIANRERFETRGFAALSTTKGEGPFAYSHKIKKGPPLSLAACRSCVVHAARKRAKFPIGLFVLSVSLAAGGTFSIVFLKRNDPDIPWQVLLFVGLLSWSLLITLLIGVVVHIVRKGEPNQRDIDFILGPYAEALAREMGNWNTFITRSQYDEMLASGYQREH